MISIEIKEVKKFMQKLLSSDCFDKFLLVEAQITTNNVFIIDAHQNQEFYATEEWEDKSIRPYAFSTWKEMRPLCYDLIKGKRTPVSFKFIFHLMPEYADSLLTHGDTNITMDQIKAFVLTVKYDRGNLNLVTGTAFHTFLLDKTPDALWDRDMTHFISSFLD